MYYRAYPQIVRTLSAQIASVFKELQLIEKYGSGIKYVAPTVQKLVIPGLTRNPVAPRRIPVLTKLIKFKMGFPAMLKRVTEAYAMQGLLFEHWQEDSKMQTIDYPPVQQALDRLKGISADAETRRQAFVRERALLDEATAINAATARGMEQGMQHEAISILERQLTKRFGPLTVDTRTKLKSASLDQLDLWADRILDAPTLAAVFDGY
jgi:hypothetical protein